MDTRPAICLNALLRNSTTPIRNCVVTFLIMAACHGAAFGQFDATGPRSSVDFGGLDVEFSVGWDGLLDLNGPVPLSFLFANYSPDPIDAQLYLTDPGAGTEVLIGNVFLSSQARRRLNSVRAVLGWNECFAELRVNGRVIWRRGLPIHSGSAADQSAFYALVVNDSGRALKAPANATPPAVDTSGPYGFYYGFGIPPALPMARQMGRPVRYAQMKTWQVPTHFGPLTMARAIIFAESGMDDDLNSGQWTAIGRWMCQGGVVVVNSNSKKIVDAIIRHAPLTPGPPVQRGPFSVRRAGAGEICEYNGQLLTADDDTTNLAIARYIGKLPDRHMGIFADSIQMYTVEGEQAVWNRILVLAFLGTYALLSGILGVVMSRRGKRFLMTYTCGVVALACASAVALGGYLRTSHGDVIMASVTTAGPGGGVQIARVDVCSAGAPGNVLRLNGPQIDVQTEVAQRRSVYNVNLSPFPPFHFTPNRLTDQKDAWEVNIRMAPWGRRRLRATAFSDRLKPVDFTCEVTATGEFTATFRNNLPFELSSCLLILAAAHKLPESEETDSDAAGQVMPGAAWGNQAQAAGLLDTDHYSVHPLKNLIPRQTETVHHRAILARKPPWVHVRNLDGHQIILPTLRRELAADAWIIGTLKDSPAITVDSEASEFQLSDEIHVYIQKIAPEDFEGWQNLLPDGH